MRYSHALVWCRLVILVEVADVGRQNAVRMKLNPIPPHKGTYAASVSSSLPPKCGILALQFHDFVRAFRALSFQCSPPTTAFAG